MAFTYLHALLFFGSIPSLALSLLNFKRQTYGGLASHCSPEPFRLLTFPGLQVLNINTILLLNQTIALPRTPGLADILVRLVGSLPMPVTGSFCNITVTYTHPGWNDKININAILPFKWNGRFLANGGGGFVAGSASNLVLNMLLQGTSEYVLATTDGGHLANPSDADPWPLASPGNLNWPLLVNFASVALHDLAVVGKAVTKVFYSTPPKYSYFLGGSTGGRQGHMLAQRYPEDFDGIIGCYPAIYWTRLMISMGWPTFAMDQVGYYPPSCELDAITAAAVKACDELDGVKDGIISNPNDCDFAPKTAIGQQVSCGANSKVVSAEGAKIMQMIWDGPKTSDGDFQWFGYSRGAEVSLPGQVANTVCDPTNTVCKPNPFALPFDWISWFVRKDSRYTLRNVTHEEWDAVMHQSSVEFSSIMETDDIDLARLQKSGTKLLSWHGTVDPLIPMNSTAFYFDQVLAKQPNVTDYYRFYIAPGAGHSPYGGIAPLSSIVLAQMQDWVENGEAPDVLHAQGKTPDGITMERDLCLYPRVQHFTGGDFTKAESYICI